LVQAGDALFKGKLVIHQPKKGYRFAIDAVLLAGLTKVRPTDRVVDLGTGCGVIPLIFAHRGNGKQIAGLEIQPELVELARQNVLINGFSGKIAIHEGDFRESPMRFRAGSFELVVSNPPYRRLHSGRLNLDGQRAVARHELKASVVDVCRVASHLLGHGGRLSVIYPATRLGHLLATAQEYGLSPKQLTVIYSTAASGARLVCLEGRKGAGEELQIMPPFYIYNENKTYTEAMRLLYEEHGRNDRVPE
jgi:tRNA1Val (adenine37-N6)-methyltransferase